MRHRRTVILILAALAAVGREARAGAVAVPEYSTVDSVLVACPAGDLVFHAIARIGPTILALRTWTIWVDITDCPELKLGTLAGPYLSRVQVNGRDYLEQMCSPSGYAEFRIPGGGIAAGRTLPVIETNHGVVLATRHTLLSPDQDGNLVVDGRDVARVRSKLGTADPTADFNLDGMVTQADLDSVQAHLGHFDPAVPTPAAAASWGRLKSLYR